MSSPTTSYFQMNAKVFGAQARTDEAKQTHDTAKHLYDEDFDE